MSAETQLDRIEGRVVAIDDRLRQVELRLAKDDGERGVTERKRGRFHAAAREFISPIITAALTAAGTLAAAAHMYGGPK